ncbi:T-cell receptor alpha chain V region CTL-F3 [Triplophysa tibetana]|nr:T-cell receptor alpha chain V region CTL-F3 [Triplophysa tibetana]
MNVVSCFISGCNSQDSVDQSKRLQSAFEGQTTTITCTYESLVTPDIFWYQQRVNESPKYMLNRFDKEFKERFKADLSTSSKSFPLIIHEVDVSDSAVYYCALRPTVTETHQHSHKNTV